MKLAIVGATGMVGSVMLKVLEERNLPFSLIHDIYIYIHIFKHIQDLDLVSRVFISFDIHAQGLDLIAQAKLVSSVSFQLSASLDLNHCS